MFLTADSSCQPLPKYFISHLVVITFITELTFWLEKKKPKGLVKEFRWTSLLVCANVRCVPDIHGKHHLRIGVTVVRQMVLSYKSKYTDSTLCFSFEEARKFVLASKSPALIPETWNHAPENASPLFQDDRRTDLSYGQGEVLWCCGLSLTTSLGKGAEVTDTRQSNRNPSGHAGCARDRILVF